MNQEPQPQPIPPPQAPAENRTLQMMIPTQNMPALIGYYCGVFGLIPFLGLPLSLLAIILGIIGLKKYQLQPTPGARAHAITAIVLGCFELVVFLGFIVYVIAATSAAWRYG